MNKDSLKITLFFIVNNMSIIFTNIALCGIA